MGTDRTPPRVLYVIVCATPRARLVGELVELVSQRGWTPCVVATPQAMNFIDKAALETRTGYPVRSQYKHPDEPDVLPAPDAILVCPASFNTINKWAAGISDTLALGLVTEGIGAAIPLIAAPAVNSAQAAHPAFERNVDELRAAGVTFLYGPGVWEPAPPRSGEPPSPGASPLTLWTRSSCGRGHQGPPTSDSSPGTVSGGCRGDHEQRECPPVEVVACAVPGQITPIPLELEAGEAGAGINRARQCPPPPEKPFPR